MNLTARTFFALALVSSLAPSAHAAKWECGERSNLPIEGKSYCAAGDFRQSETNLGKLLDALIARHHSKFGDAEALMESQRTFELYRDAHCTAENKRVEDQPFHSMMVSQCKTRLTNLRMQEIDEMNRKLR